MFWCLSQSCSLKFFCLDGNLFHISILWKKKKKKSQEGKRVPSRYITFHMQKWKNAPLLRTKLSGHQPVKTQKNAVGYCPIFSNSFYRFDSFSPMFPKQLFLHGWKAIQLLSHLFSSAVGMYCILIVIFSNTNILYLSSYPQIRSREMFGKEYLSRQWQALLDLCPPPNSQALSSHLMLKTMKILCVFHFLLK